MKRPIKAAARSKPPRSTSQTRDRSSSTDADRPGPTRVALRAGVRFDDRRSASSEADVSSRTGSRSDARSADRSSSRAPAPGGPPATVRPAEHPLGASPARRRKPPLRIETTTLWEYPSQHYESASGSTEQGDRDYVGATPSWLIWQLLQRYTRPGDLVVDPMCGSGTTLDVAGDLERRAAGFDLAPTRPEIIGADARQLPLDDASADFVFIDPPYSTHVDYSDDPRCIGKLDAGGEDRGEAYYAAMEDVLAEIDRVLKPDRCMALYVSDSFRKGTGHLLRAPRGTFMPIGFELFRRLRRHFAPLDIVCVVRHNRKLDQGNFHKAAEAENFFLRGFNYLFIMRKPRERSEDYRDRRGAGGRAGHDERRGRSRRDDGEGRGSRGFGADRGRGDARGGDRGAGARSRSGGSFDGRDDRSRPDRRKRDAMPPRREPPLPRDPAPGTFGVTPLDGPRRTRADKEARNPRRRT